MKAFLKFWILGLLGLALSIAFPALRIHWFAIVLAAAYLRSPRGTPWLVLAALCPFYSAFSLAPWWYWVLPFAMGTAVFSVLQKNLSMSSWAAQGVLLLFVLLAQSLLDISTLAFFWRGWPLGWDDGFWLLMSWLCGVVLLPFLSARLSLVWNRLGAWGRSARSVDLSRAEWLSARGGRLPRRPFGLEKGL